MKQIGSYIILKQIGSGATSTVYTAKHSQTNQKCCVKVISKLNIQTRKDKEHLLSEVEILRTIKHENLVKFIEFQELQEYYCIFMELIEGESLLSFINSNNGLTEKQAQHIFSQLISIISFLHQQDVSHRDIKPENIFIQTDLTVKLIDFGLSSLNSNLLSTYCGSFRYAAPECISREPYKGSSADMWSLGVVLFVMICGKLPWMDSHLKRVADKIINADYTIPEGTSDLCKDLISHLIVKNPSERLTAEEVKSHKWLINSFSNKKSKSKRVYLKAQRSASFPLKWVSSSKEITRDETESIQSSFNLKHADILGNNLIAQRRNAHA
jgi:5'-AMP-activated protein kinase catalytic alpha subunit